MEGFKGGGSHRAWENRPDSAMDQLQNMIIEYLTTKPIIEVNDANIYSFATKPTIVVNAVNIYGFTTLDLSTLGRTDKKDWMIEKVLLSFEAKHAKMYLAPRNYIIIFIKR